MTSQKRARPYGRCDLLGAESAREGAGRRSDVNRACATRGRNRGGAVRCVLSEGSGRVRAARRQGVRILGGRHRPEQGGQNLSLGQSSGPGSDRWGRGRGARSGGRRLGLNKCSGRGAPGRWAELGRTGPSWVRWCGTELRGPAAGNWRHWGPDRTAPAVVMAVVQPSGSLVASLESGPRLAVPLPWASWEAVGCNTPRLPDASLLGSGLPALKASRVSQVSKHLVKINMHLGRGHRLHPRNSLSVFCPRIVPDRISLTFAFLCILYPAALLVS